MLAAVERSSSGQSEAQGLRGTNSRAPSGLWSRSRVLASGEWPVAELPIRYSHKVFTIFYCIRLP